MSSGNSCGVKSKVFKAYFLSEAKDNTFYGHAEVDPSDIEEPTVTPPPKFQKSQYIASDSDGENFA